MGIKASRAALSQDVFQPIADWNQQKVQKMLNDYKTQDLDFGLDDQQLSLILNGEQEFASRIITAFDSKNGLINALGFISASALVADGTKKDKARLCFDCFDFDESQKISMDEMTILLLCVLKGLVVMLGKGQAPKDEEMEAITIEAYRHYDLNNNDEISRNQFCDWILTKLIGLDEAQTLEDLLQKLKLYKKQIRTGEETPDIVSAEESEKLLSSSLTDIEPAAEVESKRADAAPEVLASDVPAKQNLSASSASSMIDIVSAEESEKLLSSSLTDIEPAAEVESKNADVAPEVLASDVPAKQNLSASSMNDSQETVEVEEEALASTAVDTHESKLEEEVVLAAAQVIPSEKTESDHQVGSSNPEPAPVQEQVAEADTAVSSNELGTEAGTEAGLTVPTTSTEEPQQPQE